MCQKPIRAGNEKTVRNGKFELKVDFGSVIDSNRKITTNCVKYGGDQKVLPI